MEAHKGVAEGGCCRGMNLAILKSNFDIITIAHQAPLCKSRINCVNHSHHLGFVGEYTVKLTSVLILRDHFVNRCTVDLIRTTEIVETRIIVLVVRGSQLFLNLRLTRLIQVNVGFEQVTHFQHCPMIKRIPVPVADFPECLVQFVKESRIVGQVFFEDGKLLLHHDIQPAGLEEGLRNLRQAYHLVDQREFANILTNMTLQRETVSACLLLGRCRNLSISGLDNNSIVVLNA